MEIGRRVLAPDGQTVIIDDSGLLQTWQEGRADNVDSNHPLELFVYLPPTVRGIYFAVLRFRLLPFRAFAKATESTGESVLTSASGGAVSTSTLAGGAVSSSTLAGGGDYVTSDVQILKPGVSQDYTVSAGEHNHGIPNGTRLVTEDGSTVGFVESGDHVHWLYNHGHEVNIPDHAHAIEIPSHAHDVSIPSHKHSVTIPGHSHNLAFGIWTSSQAQDVTVAVNGNDITSELGGPFNTDQTDLNLANYFQIGTWNKVSLGSSTLGRIDASIFIQVLLTA